MIYTQLRAHLDKLQDVEDQKAGKHVEIPLTVALLAELLYQSEVSINLARKQEE